MYVLGGTKMSTVSSSNKMLRYQKLIEMHACSKGLIFNLLLCLKYCYELKKAFLLYNLVMMIRNSKFGQTKMEQSRCPFQNTNAMHCNVTKSASVNKVVRFMLHYVK